MLHETSSRNLTFITRSGRLLFWAGLTVAGQSPAEDLVGDFYPQTERFKTNFAVDDLLVSGEVGVPVLGLYPDTVNDVLIRVYTAEQTFLGDIDITTGPVLKEESVTVELTDSSRMEPGFTYLNDRIYDHHGNVRWKGPMIYRILSNGNIQGELTEYNLLGREIHSWTLPSHLSYHHDARELPNGNVVVCVNNSDTSFFNADGVKAASVEDYLVELDRSSSIVNAWNLMSFMDVDRATVAKSGSDWFHLNTVGYDEYDDSIIVSGRYQGLAKVSRNGVHGDEDNKGKSLIWILAPHLDWGMSGWDGTGALDPRDYLLTAVDADGTPYSDDVQDNLAPPDEELDSFYWPIGQHGATVTSRQDGKLTLITFNNQASFVFDGVDTINNGVTWGEQGDLSNDREPGPYSQIIEYEIDEEKMTVRQLWSYGDNQLELYGSYASGVNLLAETWNRVLISSGYDQHDQDNNPYNPWLVELTEDGDVVFELQVEDTDASAYRGGRVELYQSN